MKLSEALKKYGDCEVKSELIDLIDTKPKCSECENRFKNTCNAKKYETGDPYIIGPASVFDGSYGNILQMKTSPRWCPLRGDK